MTSYRLARRRMAYETWWSVHLYTYLALLLSFPHQVDTGASFVGHPVARLWWTFLWLGTLGVVVTARIALPVWRSLRHQVRVVGVRPEGPGVVSILLRGRKLDRLPVAGGQFLQWRFLRPGLWWQAHPYSLSAAPAGDLLRITVKDLGDHSAGLTRLRSGTRLAIEGPYGTFTADTAKRDRLLLVGAGVGTAPILALLQELPPQADVTVLLRASTHDDLVLRDEVADEVERRGGRLVELIGSRDQVRLGAAALRKVVPDVRGREVYLCGPDALSRQLVSELERAGVPEPQIHFELHLLSRRPPMQRSPIVIAATIAGTAGVLAFHPQSATVQPATAAISPTTSTSSSSTTSSGTSSSNGSGSGSGSGSSGSSAASGDAVDTRYGSAQVRVTVTDGKIVKIEALQLQNHDPRSVQISSSAAPILQQEALAKQTADVDAVSGATYTSASYMQSLQSALDKLGFKASGGSVATLQVP